MSTLSSIQVVISNKSTLIQKCQKMKSPQRFPQSSSEKSRLSFRRSHQIFVLNLNKVQNFYHHQYLRISVTDPSVQNWTLNVADEEVEFELDFHLKE